MDAWIFGALRSDRKSASGDPMSQYDSLWRALGTRTEKTFILSFGQIE